MNRRNLIAAVLAGLAGAAGIVGSAQAITLGVHNAKIVSVITVGLRPITATAVENDILFVREVPDVTGDDWKVDVYTMYMPLTIRDADHAFGSIPTEFPDMIGNDNTDEFSHHNHLILAGHEGGNGIITKVREVPSVCWGISS